MTPSRCENRRKGVGGAAQDRSPLEEAKVGIPGAPRSFAPGRDGALCLRVSGPCRGWMECPGFASWSPEPRAGGGGARTQHTNLCVFESPVEFPKVEGAGDRERRAAAPQPGCSSLGSQFPVGLAGTPDLRWRPATHGPASARKGPRGCAGRGVEPLWESVGTEQS